MLKVKRSMIVCCLPIDRVNNKQYTPFKKKHNNEKNNQYYYSSLLYDELGFGAKHQLDTQRQY